MTPATTGVVRRRDRSVGRRVGRRRRDVGVGVPRARDAYDPWSRRLDRSLEVVGVTRGRFGRRCGE